MTDDDDDLKRGMPDAHRSPGWRGTTLDPDPR
jgi:hypothetical protein